MSSRTACSVFRCDLVLVLLSKTPTGDSSSGSLQPASSSFAFRGCCAPWRQHFPMERCPRKGLEGVA